MRRLQWLGLALASMLLIAVAPASDPGAPHAQDGDSAEEVFQDHISGPIVQSRCINCHVEGGQSGHTRLVLVRDSVADHEARNLRAFETLLEAVESDGGASYVLNKIQGVAHGGGPQVVSGSTEFANMQRFLGLLGRHVATAKLTPPRLFDTVVMASNRKTLRRAALIFAGRIPTDAEYAAAEGGDSALRRTIRGLMQGPGFHDFLIRGSNDRLLTDRDVNRVIDISATSYLVDAANLYHNQAVAVSQGRMADVAFGAWTDHVQFGFQRAPLELIAYVAENERPYTEILTADYIMANPMAAEAYGASTYFSDPDDPYEFRPSEIVSYYRDDDSKVTEYSLETGTKVIDPGDLRTSYPHAGILNTTVFLRRYPTTATNRNRARSRWTYYHFLGIDVEKSAARTTDPVALADISNPTMHNPACTVCHTVLDPLAGAFQNYGEEGFYKDKWGGLDSLDHLYKEQVDRAELPVQAESWSEREPLAWRATLTAGVETLRVMYSDHFWDEVAEEGGRMYLDRLNVVDGDGRVVASREFEDLPVPVADWGNCGEAQSAQGGRKDHLELWGGWEECAFYIDVDIATAGGYDIEVVAWSDGHDERYHNDIGFARLSVVVSGHIYQEGDTWYRDMRTPGFGGGSPPNADSSLQWLAKQIAADPRFAAAAVRFWWPAIMGSEVAEPPEESSDADFEGLLLAAGAQGAEVERLARGFRYGFPGSSYKYNLKDLLVEIVLSDWFRADAVTDSDPVRRTALRDAGARRMLTPEELAHKTAAITGVQWGRYIQTDCWPQCLRYPNALTDDYRLFYGGIDSGGVTDRSRDITSVMAGVAKRHAAEVSCSVVMREIYLLPDSRRRLFAGVDLQVTPRWDAGGVFEIDAGSPAAKDVLSLNASLQAGSKTVNVTFLNDYWHEVRGDRNVRLDRLEVRSSAGRLVQSYELAKLAAVTDCNYPLDDHFALHCSGSLEIPIEVPAEGNYILQVSAWADQAGDELPRLSVAVESGTTDSAGADAIRSTLVELHDVLLGVEVAADSPDVQAAYRLFVEVWQRGVAAQENYFEAWRCEWWDDIRFLEGIADDVLVERANEDGYRWYEFGDRAHAFLDGIDFSDPHHIAQTWAVVLAAMMMDYRYLYL